MSNFSVKPTPSSAELAAPRFDPTTFQPEQTPLTTFPTIDALKEDVTTPLMKRDGEFRPVEDWVSELSNDKQTAIRQVARALENGGNYDYVPSGVDLSKLRPPINVGLAQGGGECDFFASVGYYALSHVLGSNNARVVQAFANGGWHNVTVYRDPDSQKWNVLNYHDIIQTNSSSPEAAVRSLFGNVELAVLYKTDDPSKRGSIDMRLRSDHQASLTGALSRPGIDAALSPSFGTTTGMNEGTVGSLPVSALQTPGTLNQGYAVRASAAGATLAARFTPNGFDRAGVSYLHQIKGDQWLGGKTTVARDKSGSGLTVLSAVEWWKLSETGYIGAVLGVDTRIGVGTSRFDDGTTLSTVGPVAALSGGRSDNIVGDKQTPTQLSWFANGHGQLALPLAVDAAARKQIRGNSNGQSPGGVIDPGFLGLIEIGGNSGFALRHDFSPQLSTSATLATRLQLQDPTLNGWPVSIALVGSLDLTYRDNGLFATLGASGGTGLYDRDILASGHARLGMDLGEGSIGASMTGGVFMTGEIFGAAGIGYARKAANGQQFNAQIGATLTSSGDAVDIAPSASLSFQF